MYVFVGHGRSGALLIANGKPLKGEDFPAHLLGKTELAILVACSSAVASDGLLDARGLLYAFHSGGTPAVIASQWNVDAKFTKDQLLDSLLSHLQNGESPAHALFETRKELFRLRPHPYYWAAFTVSGRP